jgi:hypothetical protein
MNMDNDNFFTLSSKNDNYFDSSPSKNNDKSYTDKYYQKKYKSHNRSKSTIDDKANKKNLKVIKEQISIDYKSPEILNPDSILNLKHTLLNALNNINKELNVKIDNKDQTKINIDLSAFLKEQNINEDDPFAKRMSRKIDLDLINTINNNSFTEKGI